MIWYVCCTLDSLYIGQCSIGLGYNWDLEKSSRKGWDFIRHPDSNSNRDPDQTRIWSGFFFENDCDPETDIARTRIGIWTPFSFHAMDPNPEGKIMMDPGLQDWTPWSGSSAWPRGPGADNGDSFCVGWFNFRFPWRLEVGSMHRPVFREG